MKERNLEVARIFTDDISVTATRLVWAAMCGDYLQLKDHYLQLRSILRDMTTDEAMWKENFPGVDNKYYDNFSCLSEVREFLINTSNYGFYAEFHFPNLTNFKYQGDEPWGWSNSDSICTYYFYSDSLEELVEKVRAKYGEHFEQCRKLDRGR